MTDEQHELTGRQLFFALAFLAAIACGYLLRGLEILASDIIEALIMSEDDHY